MRPIQVRGLSKVYRSAPALRGIDISVEQGEIFALLGPNGAGKTTTVEILEGHRQRSGGEVRVLSMDPESAGVRLKSRIGIVLQSTGLEPYLTVEEAIEMYRGYYPRPRSLDEIIELVGLSPQRESRVKRLSGGQQRRLDVAIGLAGDPELLFLDEPTTGFDPAARRSAWEVVKNLATLGKTIFLTTHYMEEAQYLADRVAILVAGKVVAEGPPQQLASRASASTKITFKLTDGERAADLPLLAAPHTSGMIIETHDPIRDLNRLTGWAIDTGVELLDLSVHKPSLEDAYLELTREATETEA